MTERPILFSAPMVRAILDGSKTQTRRILKPQPSNGWEIDTPYVLGRITSPHPKRMKFGVFIHRGLGTDFPECDIITNPYGKPGDRLWVREAWAYHPDFPESTRRAIYRADRGSEHDVDRWRPSIHMPRWASRINLEITGVRVERLCDISKDDAMAEGIVIQPDGGFGLADSTHYNFSDPTDSFCSLWESINGAGSWMANPFVWVVEFKQEK